MKKFILFFFLLITAAATFFPCCLYDECCADQATSASHSNNHEKEGACSPFAACAACACFVELTKPVQLMQPVAEKPVHHQTKYNFLLASYSSFCWQPPRSC